MRFRYVFLASCLGLFLGCGGSDSDTTTPMPTPSTDETSSSPEPNSSSAAVDSTQMTDGPMEDDASGCVATKAGELCVMIKVPEDVPSIPTKVSVHFFSALPPMGPPTILGAEIAEKSELEKFQPGATVPSTSLGCQRTAVFSCTAFCTCLVAAQKHGAQRRSRLSRGILMG